MLSRYAEELMGTPEEPRRPLHQPVKNQCALRACPIFAARGSSPAISAIGAKRDVCGAARDATQTASSMT